MHQILNFLKRKWKHILVIILFLLLVLFIFSPDFYKRIFSAFGLLGGGGPATIVLSDLNTEPEPVVSAEDEVEEPKTEEIKKPVKKVAKLAPTPKQEPEPKKEEVVAQEETVPPAETPKTEEKHEPTRGAGDDASSNSTPTQSPAPPESAPEAPSPAPDTTPPVITLNGEAYVFLIKDSEYVDAGATAVDDVDVSVSVVTTGSVDIATVGVYTITYTATDIAGNIATTTRQVEVYVEEGPILE